MSLLELREVYSGYGPLTVLFGVSLSLDEGELVAVIGPNGAGKSTLLKTISGLLRPKRGEVIYAGQRLNGLGPDQVVRRGVVLCPEGRRVFPEMTVLENLQMGAYVWGGRPRPDDLEYVFELFPILKERQKQLAGTLSGGEQQMLAIGRSLMARPRLLLLDEPSLGLAPMVVRNISQTVGQLHRRGLTILLVEQNAHMALGLAGRVYVLENGVVRAQGVPADLQADEKIRMAYLGV